MSRCRGQILDFGQSVKLTRPEMVFGVTSQDCPFRTGSFSAFVRLTQRGPGHAGQSAMTKIAYSESESGNVVRTAIVPANRSEEPRFGPLDRTVIAVILLCFLVCVAGLIYPLTH
jgi:hypothetical protein